MSDELARVTGASDIIKVGRTKYKASPLSLCQLQELQRSALRYYQDQYMEAFSNGLKYLDNGSRDDRIVEENRKVSAWDIKDLPCKELYDIGDVDISDDLKQWIKTKYRLDDDSVETKSVRGLIEASLNERELAVEEYEKLQKCRPRINHIPYDFFWITSDSNGIVEFVYASLKIKNKITREDIKSWSIRKLLEVRNKVEEIVSPAMGNM